MAKGTLAKQNLIKRFATVLGKDYLGTDGTKHYFMSEENGEKIQVAISMTCPKTPFGGSNGEINFESDDVFIPVKSQGVEPSQEEKEIIKRLIQELEF